VLLPRLERGEKKILELSLSKSGHAVAGSHLSYEKRFVGRKRRGGGEIKGGGGVSRSRFLRGRGVEGGGKKDQGVIVNVSNEKKEYTLYFAKGCSNQNGERGKNRGKRKRTKIAGTHHEGRERAQETVCPVRKERRRKVVK